MIEKEKAPDGTFWVRMAFKGNKVWVGAHENGEAMVSNGKVRVRYKPDDPRTYSALAKSVMPLAQGQVPAESQRAPKKSKEKAPVPDFSLPDVPPNAILIYTDGAALGNPGPAGIGVVMRYGEHVKEIGEYIGEDTNNVAELSAILAGLKAVKKRNLPVRLFTDSQYAYNVLTQGWKAKANVELVNEIKAVMKTFENLKFAWVKGHAGHPENERADALATGAAERREKTPKNPVA